MNLNLTLPLISATLLLLVTVMLFFFFFRGCFGRRRHKQQINDIECASSSKLADAGPAAARRLGWSEVELLTSGFTSKVVGEGGFSTVYLGRLPPDHSTPVAVKLHRSSERLRRAFLRELDACLAHLPHPNLVRLLAYCDDPDQAGVLVFDYAPNGTLFDNLHRRRGPLLTWPQRMRVACGVASAVAHLHGGGGGATQVVVHGDLTSSNVLLDRNLGPVLCDLGSALVGFSAAVGRSGRSGRLLLGSPGYADPLQLRTGTVSKKTDVYSFGVLLLELITGAPALAEEEEGRRHSLLTAAVGPVVREGDREGVRGILDIRLGEEFDEGELMAVAAVAGRCIGDRPGLRPSMAEILAIMRESISVVGGGSDG